MNIKELCRQWLIERNVFENEPYFEKDLKSLYNMIREIVKEQLEDEGRGCSIPPLEELYDSTYGDDKECSSCKHTYERHFDTYDNMEPVGCKYCKCEKFIK